METVPSASPTNKKTSCWLKRMPSIYTGRASGMPPAMFVFCLKNSTTVYFQSMMRRTGRAMVVGRKSLSFGFLNAQGDTRGINQGNVALPTKRKPLPSLCTWGLRIHDERGQGIQTRRKTAGPDSRHEAYSGGRSCPTHHCLQASEDGRLGQPSESAFGQPEWHRIC